MSHLAQFSILLPSFIHSYPDDAETEMFESIFLSTTQLAVVVVAGAVYSQFYDGTHKKGWQGENKKFSCKF